MHAGGDVEFLDIYSNDARATILFLCIILQAFKGIYYFRISATFNEFLRQIIND